MDAAVSVPAALSVSFDCSKESKGPQKVPLYEPVLESRTEPGASADHENRTNS